MSEIEGPIRVLCPLDKHVVGDIKNQEDKDAALGMVLENARGEALKKCLEGGATLLDYAPEVHVLTSMKFEDAETGMVLDIKDLGWIVLALTFTARGPEGSWTDPKISKVDQW